MAKQWPQRMRGDRFGDAATAMRFLARLLHGVLANGPAGDITWEEPQLGLLDSPPVPQDFQQLGGEHNVAIFLPLALFDADDHAPAIDGVGFEADGLRDSHPGGVTGGEDGAMLEAGHASEKLPDLFRTENDRQFLRLLGSGNDRFEGPLFLEGDLIEEAKGGDGETARIG